MQNIHPLFVHFPIALLLFSVACDVTGKLLKKDSLESAGWWGLFFGMIAIAAAAATGLLAASTVPHPEATHEIMENHEHLELIAGSIFLILFIIRIANKARLPQKKNLAALYMVLALAGIGVMLSGAHLGGKLVYDFGVGTKLMQIPESQHLRH